MKDTEREYVRAYIQDNNILRPMEYAQIGSVFITISSLIFIINIFFVEHMHKARDIVDFIVLAISIIFVVLSLYLRKKNKQLYTHNMGIVLYKSEEEKYLLMMSLIVAMWYMNYDSGNQQETLVMILVSLIMGIITVFSTFALQQLRVKRGFYLKKEKTKNKRTDELKLIIVILIIGNILLKMPNNSIKMNILVIVTVILPVLLLYYATTYWLKLRYAKMYDMEEYLPTEPL